MPVGETIKMVGIRKNPNEPLGLTVELDDYNQLIVSRILAGGMIDRQGLLNPGDVILEVNGVGVKSPEELQTEISHAKESVTLKIGPSVDEEMKSARLTAVDGGAQVKSKTQEVGRKLAVSTALKLSLILILRSPRFPLSPIHAFIPRRSNCLLAFDSDQKKFSLFYWSIFFCSFSAFEKFCFLDFRLKCNLIDEIAKVFH